MPRGRELPLDSTPAAGDVVVIWKTTGVTRQATLGSLPGATPAGAANLVQATPDGSSGVAALRSLAPADLPAASISAKGAVTLATPSSDVTAGHVVQANDTRLSNSRTPTAHHATHEPGGSDPMAVDAVAATGSLRTLGTGATQAAPGNDSRLSDARTPTAHAASHKNGGTDEVATSTPAANAIPKAGSGGTLATGWIPTLNQNTTGTAGGLSVTNDVPHGGTGVATLAAHGVVLGNGTGAVAVSGPGTSGQVMTSNGASADPTFQPLVPSQLGSGTADSTKVLRGNQAWAKYQTVYKSADESVTSSVTLQNDDHLSVTLSSGSIYRFEADLNVDVAPAGGGIQVALTGTATATHFIVTAQFFGLEGGGSLSHVRQFGLNTAMGDPISTGDSQAYVHLAGSIEVNAGGTFRLAWAQQISNASATKVLRGSTITVEEIF